MLDWAVDVLKTYGLAGVVIGALGYAVERLFSHLSKSWEDRRTDAGAAATVVRDNTEAVKQLTAEVRDLRVELAAARREERAEDAAAKQTIAALADAQRTIATEIRELRLREAAR